MDNSADQPHLKASHKVKYFIIAFVGAFIIVGIIIFVVLGINQSNTNQIQTTTSNGSSTNTKAESWAVNDQFLVSNRTSTSTIKISDSLFRMYFQSMGSILYSDSQDGVAWGDSAATGIQGDINTMISNPSVLKITEDNWIMTYEHSPNTQNHGQPSASSQRDIYVATSADGKTFGVGVRIIDSSINDNYFASVPDLVLLPDGSIRMYYVTRGDEVGSQLSTDNGMTWTKEAGVRIGNGAVDPEVILKEGKWVMYYSQLNNANNGIFKATSNDGFTWTALSGSVIKKVTGIHLVDPDVVEVSANNYEMFYGEFSETQNNPPDLHVASFNGSIFSN